MSSPGYPWLETLPCWKLHPRTISIRSLAFRPGQRWWFPCRRQQYSAGADSGPPRFPSLPPPSTHRPAAMRSGWQAAKTSPCRGKKSPLFTTRLSHSTCSLFMLKSGILHLVGQLADQAQAPKAVFHWSYSHLHLLVIFSAAHWKKKKEVSVMTAGATLGEGEV